MKPNGVKNIIILIITIVLCVCSCGYEEVPPFSETQQFNTNTLKIQTSEPVQTKTQTPTKTPVSKLRPFNPVYPLSKSSNLMYTKKNTVKEMTGDYSPYTVTLIYNKSACLAGGYKDGIWHDAFDFVYNGMDYFKIYDDLFEQGKDKEADKLREDLLETDVISALINYETNLKLYSSNGYIGEYKPAPMCLIFGTDQRDIVYAGTKMEYPQELVVGISHENPFPRKPVYIGDEGNFEIDLCGDGEIQKVVFHKVIEKCDDLYYFSIEAELIVYGKSYSISNYILNSFGFEESEFPEDPDAYFKEEYNNEYYNTIQILPIDLNGDGKMELVCYSYNNRYSDNRSVCSVYAIGNNELCYINYWADEDI